MTPRTRIWLIVKPLTQYKPLLLFQAVQTSIFYKLVLLTERVLSLRKMRSVALMEKSPFWLPTYQVWLENISRDFSFFWKGNGGGGDLADRNKMQDISKYLHLEAEWELSVTQLRYRGLKKRSVIPGLEQGPEPGFTASQADALIRTLLTTLKSTPATILSHSRGCQSLLQQLLYNAVLTLY